MLVRNWGHDWEFDLGHSQCGIGWEFVKFVQRGWESTKNISVGKMTNKIIQTFGKNGTVWKFAFKKSWKPCSFGWEMVGKNYV